jgi:hypothetical protein
MLRLAETSPSSLSRRCSAAAIAMLTTMAACHSTLHGRRAMADGSVDVQGESPPDAPRLSGPDTQLPEREVQPGWYGLGTSELSPWRTQPIGSASAGGLASNTLGARAVFDREDRPIVAWLTQTLQICALRFVAPSWEDLGCVALPAASEPFMMNASFFLAIDSKDTLYVAAANWSDSPVTLHVFARQADTWRELPSPGTAAMVVGKQRGPVSPVFVDAEDRPVVIVSSTDSETIAVAAWTGVGWSPRGTLSSPSAIVLDTDRTLVAVTYDQAGDLHFMRNQGDQWIDLEIPPLPFKARLSSVGIDDQHRPVLVTLLQEGMGTGMDPMDMTAQLIVYRWSGLSWDVLSAMDPIEGDYWVNFFTIASGQLLLSWWSTLLNPAAGFSESNHLARWNATAWQDLGLPDSVGAEDIAVDSKGNLFVVGGSDVYGLWWNGTSWIELGQSVASGISNLSGSVMPALALDSVGNPVVAWLGPNGGAYLRGWDGTAWAELAGSGSGKGIGAVGAPSVSSFDAVTPRPQLALDSQDRPTVLWQAGDVKAPPRLRSYDGSTWRALGGSDDTLGLFSAVALPSDGCSTIQDQHLAPSLALDPSGRPLVAWSWERRQAYRCDPAWMPDTLATFVLAWKGSSWSALAGSSIPPGIGQTSYPVALAVGAQGAPIVFGPQFSGPCSPVRYDGGMWQTLGNAAWPVKCGSGINNRALAVDSVGNPVVAWTTTAPEVYLLRWNGSIWEELDGSASGGGVTRSNHHVGQFALTVDPFDRPVVAWEDSSSGQSQIYLRRWSGADWDEVQGSASDGGVSTSSVAALAPSVAARAGRLCVAWHSAAAMHKTQIVLRCTDW